MVEQVDREAAAGLLVTNFSRSPKFAQEMLAGGRDTSMTVQAFEAHRLAATKAERERIADWLDMRARESLNGHVIAGIRDAIRAGETK